MVICHLNRISGGIDPHTHLDVESMGNKAVDDFFSGQAAALAGGTTMHIDFVKPLNGSLIAGIEEYQKKAEKSCMDYGFHMVIYKWDEVVSQEMEVVVNEKGEWRGCWCLRACGSRLSLCLFLCFRRKTAGINSFKFFMAYKGHQMVNDEVLLHGMKKCKSLGALAMVHAENGDAVFEGQNRMIELGITGPEGHALSRPPVVKFGIFSF